jgi:hypothetical protein
MNKMSFQVKATLPPKVSSISSTRIISRKSELEDYLATLLSRLIELVSVKKIQNLLQMD